MTQQKKQTRRSISVRGDIYDRVHKFCQDNEMSMSSFVEDRILNYLDGADDTPVKVQAAPVNPVVAAIEEPVEKVEVKETAPVLAPPPPPARKENFNEMDEKQIREEIRQHFTF